MMGILNYKYNLMEISRKKKIPQISPYTESNTRDLIIDLGDGTETQLLIQQILSEHTS